MADWRFFDVFGNQALSIRFEAQARGHNAVDPERHAGLLIWDEEHRQDASVLDAAFRALPSGQAGAGGLACHHFTVAEALAALHPSNAKYRVVRGGVAARGPGDSGGAFPPVA